jgi:hypothetical protein
LLLGEHLSAFLSEDSSRRYYSRDANRGIMNRHGRRL